VVRVAPRTVRHDSVVPNLYVFLDPLASNVPRTEIEASAAAASGRAHDGIVSDGGDLRDASTA